MTQYDLGKVVGDNGKGISSISKTGTSGKVDTYTITYSDSTTSTFTVTNGNDGQTGATGNDGKDGATIWTTSTAPTTPNYTFTISDLTAQTNRTVQVGDLIVYAFYLYQVETVSSTTVYSSTRQNIRGSGGKGISSISKTGTSGLVDTYTITYSDNTTSTFTVTNGSDASVNIVTSTNGWNSTTSDSKVPSEKLVKNSLDNHTHTYSNINNVSTVAVTVTYTDNSTETINLLKYTPPSS